MLRARLLTAICAATLFATQAHAAKTVVGIMDFENKAGVSYNVSDTLVDMLTTAFEKSGKFQVVERDQLDKLFDEQALGASGAVDRTTAARTGQLRGADYLLIGVVTECGVSKKNTRAYNVSISNASATLAVDIRFVDSTTGNTMFTETFKSSRSNVAVSSGHADVRTGVGHEMARDVINGVAVRTLSSVYPPKVAQVKGKEVALNYGEIMFAPGETWNILSRSEGIIDPDTGERIGYAEDEVGSIRITKTDRSLSWGELISGEASVGDVLKKAAPAKSAAPKQEKVNPFKK